MKQSLRKTPSLLHLAYKYDGVGGNVTGCHLTLNGEGSVLTLAVDLTGNFRHRDRAGRAYLDAATLVRDHHKLKFVQCHDNLVRTRLIRAWEQVAHPQLRLALLMGSRGTSLYEVMPRSLLMGGVQLDVLSVLDFHELEARSSRGWRHSGFQASGFQHSQAG
jgi:hypothetical protein